VAFQRLSEHLRAAKAAVDGNDVAVERAAPAVGWCVAGLALDAAIVLAFAAIGRRSHDESGGVASVLATAAPFLLGLAVGWVVVGVVARRRHGRFGTWLDTDGGFDIWLATIAVGLLARRFLWDRGTALSFVIVAAVFLGVALMGWRAIADRVRSSRTSG
jgi:Protein of unknown function (DUF3054)